MSRETALQRVIFEFQVCAQVCKAKVLSGTRRKLDGVKVGQGREMKKQNTRGGKQKGPVTPSKENK